MVGRITNIGGEICHLVYNYVPVPVRLIFIEDFFYSFEILIRRENIMSEIPAIISAGCRKLNEQVFQKVR